MREYFVKSMAIGFQANQVCKEENQRRNLATSNFAWLCEIQEKSSCKTNLEHFLESIVYILYIVSKLRKSGSQEVRSLMLQIVCKLELTWRSYGHLKATTPCWKTISHPCEILASLAKPNLKRINFATQCKIFASIAKSSCVISRYCAPTQLDKYLQIFISIYFISRFSSPDILCNSLFSPCNQPMIGFLG